MRPRTRPPAPHHSPQARPLFVVRAETKDSEMSALLGHADAARCIGERIRAQVSGNLLDVENVIFMGLSIAFREAADLMEAENARQLGATPRTDPNAV